VTAPEEDVLTSKVPVEIAKVVPCGFPFKPKVTVMLVENTWKDVTVGVEESV
jgi:hypothetical protein